MKRTIIELSLGSGILDQTRVTKVKKEGAAGLSDCPVIPDRKKEARHLALLQNKEHKGKRQAAAVGTKLK